MTLNNFSSLIEVATTLNIAFVAIEYIKTYSRILFNQAFKIDETIKEKFDIGHLLVDEISLFSVSEVDLNGKRTTILVERLKREREKLKNEILSKEKFFKDKIENAIVIKNLSSVSLFLFLYGITTLFIIGLEIDVVKLLFWIIMTFCLVLYAILAWFINDKHRNILFDFSSLGHAIVSYIISFLVGIIGALGLVRFVSQDFTGLYWIDYVVVFSMVFLFSNFIVAVLKVWKMAKKTSKEIDIESKEIGTKCDSFRKEFEELISGKEISSYRSEHEQLKFDSI